MEIRNAQYVDAGAIDCEVHHPEHGWLPFAAMQSDETEFARKVWAALQDMDIAPPDPKAEAHARLEAIKAECSRRIHAVASQIAQINVSTVLGVINAKPAVDRTAQDRAILDGAATGTQWVAEMRAAIAPLVADPDADFTADDAWPPCPPEAAAVYDQF